MERIMQVFYGNDFLPFKDKERVVHYPIVGNSFNGMSNVDQIRFYVKDIGGTLTLSWVAITKLPNGRTIYELLNTIGYDSECNEYYVSLSISNLYTQLKGNVYISLNGYRGEVEIETDQETGLQTITATLDSPTVVATGTIKLAINYAPQRPQGYSFDIDQYQLILNALGNKANTINTIQVVENINSLDASDYEIGQLFYCLDSERYYEIIYDTELESNNFKHKLLDAKDTANRYIVGRNDIVHYFYRGLVESGQIVAGVVFLLNIDGLGEYVAQFNPYFQAITGEKLTLFNIGTQKLYEKSINDNLTTFANVISAENEYEYVRKIKQGGIVYGTLPTDESGNVFGLPYNTNATPNNIVQRNNNGQIIVPLTPSNDNHATSKKYVDDLISTFKESELQVIDTNEFPTLQDFLEEFTPFAEEGYIYLYPIDTSDLTKGYYRYIWENNTWLSLGTTEIDLSGYYTKEQVDSFVTNLEDEIDQTKDDINNNIPKHQTNTILIVDPLTNINGRAFINYTSENVTIGGYPAIKILRGGSVLNEQYAKEYMEYMCGSYYLPKYNYDKPKNTYFIMPNGQLLKPQYDSTNGLLLYYSGQLSTKDYADGFAKSLLVTINSSTYVMTLTLKDANGNTLGTPQTVDLPLETMVVGGSYDDTTKSLILTLKNGQSISIPVGDIIDGLVSESQLQELALEIQNALNKKANIEDLEEGKIVPLLSEELTPVSKQSGSTQETPFINQGTATNNNDSQADVDTGPTGEHLEKQGNVVCVNQLGQLKATFTQHNITFTNNGDGTMTISGLSSNTDIAYIDISNTIRYKANHLLLARRKAIGNVSIVTIGGSGWSRTQESEYEIDVYNADRNCALTFVCEPNTEYNFTYKAEVADLYVWFNGDIPTDLQSHPNHWSWYYNGSLAYNTGTLTPSNGRYLECGQGRNIWDEQWEQGSIDSDGTLSSSSTRIRSKNYISVLPNRAYFYKASSGYIAYYDKDKQFIIRESQGSNRTFTTPSNCRFIKFFLLDTPTYNNNVTISLYYATANDYDKHYPYVAPKRYDTGTETLLRIPVAGGDDIVDTKAPDGTITRRVGSRAYESGDESDNSVWTDGTTTYYALETPITEQGTSFDENIEINDMSYMAWFDTDGNLVSIPQGCKLFYPAWIKGFVDSVGQREDIDWSADKIASKTDIAFKELDNAYIGAITSTQITTGFYKNDIAISGGLTNAKYVSALMSNGNLYPMMKTSSSLVCFNGLDFETDNITVSKIYYKD